MKPIIVVLILGAVISLASTNFHEHVSNPEVVTNDTIRPEKARGKQLYSLFCQSCHMEDGKGLEGVFPPLAGSDYLMEDVDRSIKMIWEGARGEMTVNGKKYNGVMAPMVMPDQQVADITNYILNSWGNKHEPLGVDYIQKLKPKK